ncbi:hypothetical protein Tdes44962_MAKER07384 [Teratosphaeria destructans]|uniref:Uncharacterized protein n=1 Tax=Teratosphaeria destructans TaxID=418781 RepID=A0A9W7W5T5_9PEZI|nr:hypothetical protein Tdes44962_MAKER07384 [Teratosphaeria destructans]
MAANNFVSLPRPSSETERRYLLAESIAPSESASMVDGDRTPRAHSPAPSEQAERFRISAVGQQYDRRGAIADPTTEPRPYRGFPSEAHYLAALHAWANKKKYLDPTDTTLYGFYGKITMEEYNRGKQPVQGLGLRKKWKARKQAKEEMRNERRNTVV